MQPGVLRCLCLIKTCIAAPSMQSGLLRGPRLIKTYIAAPSMQSGVLRGSTACPLQVTSVQELGVVSSSLDATIKICDTSRCKVLHTVTAHHRGVHSFAYSRAFSLGASGGLERDIMLWQPNTNRQVGELVGHGSSISNIVIDQRHSQVGPGSPSGFSGSQGRFCGA